MVKPEPRELLHSEAPMPGPPQVSWRLDEDRPVAEPEMTMLARQLAGRPDHDTKLGLTIPARDRETAATVAAEWGYDLHAGATVEPDYLRVELWPQGHD